MKVRYNTNYVLRKIKECVYLDKITKEELINVQVFPKSTILNEGYVPMTYQELEELLKDYETVYDFYEAKTTSIIKAFDIILEK